MQKFGAMGKQNPADSELHCSNYGFSFGAVLEEFEVRDAIEGVFTESSISSSIDMNHGTQQLSIAA